MRLRDYFAGQEVNLRSPLPAAIVAERINEAASRSFLGIGPFSPFRIGVIGRIWQGHVRLRYRRSLMEYNTKPILAGRLSDAGAGSELRLRYRAPLGGYLFFLLWYPVMALFGIVISLGEFAPGITSVGKAMFIAWMLAFLFLPLVFHVIGTRRSEEELAEMIEFLGEHAEAAPHRGPDQIGLSRR